MSVDLSQLSDEQLLQMYRQMRGNRSSGVADSVKDSPVGGFVRGLRDVIDGGAQTLVHALPQGVVDAGDAVGNALADYLPFVAKSDNSAPKLADLVAPRANPSVDQINRRADVDYQQNWRRGEDQGLDLSRIGGNIAGTLAPLRAVGAVAGPAYRAATSGKLPWRMLQGAGTGGLLSLAQPVDMSEPGASFAEQKAIQAGLGTALGAAGVPVGETVARGVGGAVNKVRQYVDRARARIDPSFNITINAKVDQVLQDAGIRTVNLPQDVLASLRTDVAAALKSGQTIDKAALSRIADAKTVGVDLLKGQATRDPKQYTFEQNTRDITGAGEPIQKVMNEQNGQLVGAINAAKPGVDPLTAGQRIIGALQGFDQRAKGAVDQAYTAARSSAGVGTEVPLQPLAQRAGEVMENFGRENLPGSVLRRLESYGVLGGTQTKSFTIEEANRLRAVINANYDPTKLVEAKALKLLTQGITDAEDLLGSQASSTLAPEATAAFAQARKLAAKRFKLIESVDALKASIDNVDPDKFVAKHLISAPVGQVRALTSILRSASPETVKELRGQVILYLKNEATNGAADEFAKFSQSGYQKALDKIGPHKLAILFPPAERTKLLALARTASTIQVRPEGAAVNEANTASAAMNLLARTRGVPYLNTAMRPLDVGITRLQANSATKPTFAQPAQLTPEQVRRLLEFGSSPGSMLGGLAGGLLGRM